MDLTVNSQQRCFEGTQGFYSHESEVCDGTMNFALYQPPQTRGGNKVPVVTFLSGLTCTEENFTVKAGAQRVAAELGLMLVRSEEHTVELPSQLRISSAVSCLN